MCRGTINLIKIYRSRLKGLGQINPAEKLIKTRTTRQIIPKNHSTSLHQTDQSNLGGKSRQKGTKDRRKKRKECRCRGQRKRKQVTMAVGLMM